MTTLHVCNNYVISKVHKNLISKLSQFSNQTVLIPCRDRGHFNSNEFESDNCKFHYFYIPNYLIKFFPLFKVFVVSIMCYFFVRKENIEKALAHTLWSDGVCVFLLSRIFRFKYSVVVRNTDINVFLPKLPHYRFLISKVVENSESLIFVSAAHKNRFEQKYSEVYKKAKRVCLIPNGIDDYWIENRLRCSVEKNTQVCYVGKFDANKNIPAIINACEIVKENIDELKLVLVGGNKNEFLSLTGLSEVPFWVKIVERTESKEELIDIYRNSSVFFMPSFTETFGLVYFESLSQGCSILATKGEGIDGYISEDFVRFSEPTDYLSMAQSLEYLLNKYTSGIPLNKLEQYISELSWDSICNQYIHIME